MPALSPSPVEASLSTSTAPALRGKTLAHPDGIAALKNEILALAGVDKNRLARLLDRSLTVAEEAMHAEKVQRVTHKGEVTETFNDIDHAARLAGGAVVQDIVGVKQGKGGGEGASTVTYNITYAPTSPVRQATVIEADHT